MSEIPIVINGDQAAAELCKRPGGFTFFVKEFWEEVVADEQCWNWHMDVLCQELEVVIRNLALRVRIDGDQTIRYRNKKLHDLIINIPPGTTKSTICTIMAPVWAWIIDPTLRIITGSHTETLAMGHALKSRDIIKSPKFRRYFPHIEIKGDQDLKTNYENTLLGQRMATSVDSKSVMGKHAHLIIIDDPIDPKGSKSQLEVNAANNWMDSTLSQRKVDKAVTATILIMQRLSTNDPTGHQLSKNKASVRHICLPAIRSEEVKPEELKAKYHQVIVKPEHPIVKIIGSPVVYLLDKNRIGPEVIAEAHIDLGGDGFSGQYQQVPVQEGGLIWREWFVPVPDAVFPDLKQMTQVGTDWDLAYTDKDNNAASAYITSGKFQNKMFIDDLGWVRFEFPELIKFMKEHKAPHYIEAKASGKSAKQTLVKHGIPSIEVTVQGGDKVARARLATPYAEAGLCYIRKSLLDKLYHDSRQGILSFPRNPDMDLADTLAQAIQRIFRSQTVSATSRTSPLDSIKPL